MKEQAITFYSDNLALDGAFFVDEAQDDPSLPIVIICSGFTGLRSIHPERFARALTPRGLTCFGFDYRGFGNSEGARERVLIEEQVRDIAAAVSVARERADAEGRPLALAGWGMGAGLVLEAFTISESVDALLAMNGFYDSVRVQRALRGEQGWRDFVSFTRGERRRLARGEEHARIDPFDIYPLDPVSREYVDNVLRKTPGYGVDTDLSFADSLLTFRPEALVDERFAATPLLIAHGENNALHPVTEPRSLYARYPGPKTLYLLPGAGHTEWMLDEDPRFKQFAKAVGDWLAETLVRHETVEVA